jgi:hypothetical protein
LKKKRSDVNRSEGKRRENGGGRYIIRLTVTYKNDDPQSRLFFYEFCARSQLQPERHLPNHTTHSTTHLEIFSPFTSLSSWHKYTPSWDSFFFLGGGEEQIDLVVNYTKHAQKESAILSNVPVKRAFTCSTKFGCGSVAQRRYSTQIADQTQGFWICLVASSMQHMYSLQLQSQHMGEGTLLGARLGGRIRLYRST